MVGLGARQFFENALVLQGFQAIYLYFSKM
jgi:hypothetical protein